LSAKGVSKKPDRHKAMQPNSKPLIVPVFLPHAGCPHRCVFCNQNAITGATTLPTHSEFESAINRFLSYAAGRPAQIQIAFYGGNFLGMGDAEVIALLELAQQFVRDGRADSIRFSTRPDTIDEHRLQLISGYSVRTVELGAQSMNDEVLALTRRGHTTAHTVAAMQHLLKRDYEIGLQMMVGLPGDTVKRSMDTARRMIDLRPHYVRIYPAVVLEGSRMAKWYRQGRFVPWSLETCVSLVKEIYLLFKHDNIAVIRMGLQAEEDLDSGKAALAGPYHPAFGHLVYSKIYLDAALAVLKSSKRNRSRIRIYVHPHNISRMRGHMNQNMARLRSAFRVQKVEVIPDPFMAEDCLRLGETDHVCVNDYKSPELNSLTDHAR
jgi:histone acetyltransferase (RNA polymerase elongator complex component)